MRDKFDALVIELSNMDVIDDKNDFDTSLPPQQHIIVDMDTTVNFNNESTIDFFPQNIPIVRSSINPANKSKSQSRKNSAPQDETLDLS